MPEATPTNISFDEEEGEIVDPGELEKSSHSSSNGGGVDKEDNNAKIQTMHPSMDDFSNFMHYVQKLEQSTTFNEAGAIVIQAPDEWHPRAVGYEDLPDGLHEPTLQHVTTVMDGAYTLSIEKSGKKLSLQVKHCSESSFIY